MQRGRRSSQVRSIGTGRSSMAFSAHAATANRPITRALSIPCSSPPAAAIRSANNATSRARCGSRSVAGHSLPHTPDDCVPCHMPKAQAYDGGHTVFTDHSISTHMRRPLASYFGRQPSARNLGLAYIQLASKQRDADYLEKAWPLLREAASVQPPDPALYNAVAGFLTASGRKQQAIEYYRRSLQYDPLQPDALVNLAALLEPSAQALELRERALGIVPRAD